MQTDTTRENSQGSDSNLDLSATAPGQLRVIKRNGTVVPYTDDKITVAITKAFLAVEGGNAAASSRIHDTVARLTEQVTATFKRRMPSGGTIHIEEIQDQVENGSMRVLAISAPERQEGIDIPTFQEAGVDVVASNWRGIIACAGVVPATRAASARLRSRRPARRTW